ncbi:MAG: exodeoxyribonuclease VII large subunit [Tatlockia sp.]|jgi:exodeoxyribonuclease VII large subunit
MEPSQNALTVTQINRQIRSFLEFEVGQVAVLGEISNLSKPGSGHYYFTLKDAAAQLRCVFFRNHHDNHSKSLQEGQQVIAKGRLSLYEARGDYQLIVQSLTDAGFGELYQQFEVLKAKLQAQGLFDQAKKRALPAFPLAIAVVTSATGAALKDILTTLNRRFPLATVRIYPSEVQGKEAHLQLISAINAANQQASADVLILARGGGSIEDLWAFNNEQLALTIRNSPIPVVTGIGHETDFTIADFVADLRAATPTAAAEAVTPNQADLLLWLVAFEKRTESAIKRCLQHKQLLLSYQIAKFLSPAQLINHYWQSIDNLEQKLYHAMHLVLHQKQRTLHTLSSTLNTKNPMAFLQQTKAAVQALAQDLLRCMQGQYNAERARFGAQIATLQAVSPLATLERGYAIAQHNKTVLLTSQQVNPGDKITVRLSRGRLACVIEECVSDGA